MRKTLFIIMILITSLVFVSCATDTQEPADLDMSEVVEPEPTEDEDMEVDVEEEVVDDTEGSLYSIDNIEEFDLDIELRNDEEIEYDFDRSDNEAKVERDDEEGIHLTGDEARDEVFNLMENIEINLDRTVNDMVKDVLTYFDISIDDVDEFNLELEFLDGMEIDVKVHY